MSDPTGNDGGEHGGREHLARVRKAILVVDMVESVRLMQDHEDDVIGRWRHFVHDLRAEVLPIHRGRLVKSLGDGVLLEFDDAHNAALAALHLQTLVGRCNVGHGAGDAILLRIGGHLCSVVVDEFDVFGAGVNLAARLASLLVVAAGNSADENWHVHGVLGAMGGGDDEAAFSWRIHPADETDSFCELWFAPQVANAAIALEVDLVA